MPRKHPTLKLACTPILLEQLRAAERALRRSKTWPRTNLGELQELIIRVDGAIDRFHREAVFVAVDPPVPPLV